MSYNGSGTFLINSAGQPVVANTVISATVFNALTSDLATGLSTAITKDGQTTITNNIPFGSNKITGLGSGTAAADAANLGQVQSTVAKLITVTGTDTITGSMSPQLTAYAAGQLFYFVANAANTSAVTLNIDSLGAKNITRDGSSALAAGDINSGEVVVVIYDGTRFQMINAANSFGNTTINGTLTVTGNAGFQANVSITSALSVGGVFAVTGAATFTANPTLSGGTANGVLYLNGSKVATSGSALYFDGTNLGIGTSSPLGTLGIAGSATTTIVIPRSSNGTTASPVETQLIGSTFTNGTFAAGMYALNSFTNNSGNWLAFKTTDTGNTTATRMTLDAFGNLGLGVTPSGWVNYKAIQIGQNGAVSSADSAAVTMVNSNCFYDGTNYKYISSAEASLYQQASGAHNWRIAASGTAGNNITFTQAMTLDASGNLLVGATTNSLSARLKVAGAARTCTFFDLAAPAGENWVIDSTNTTGSTDVLGIYASGATGLYIKDTGDVGIGTTSPAATLHVAGSLKVADSTLGASKIGCGNTATVNDGATLTLTGYNQSGLLVIVDNSDRIALYLCSATGSPFTTEVSDPSGVYSTTQGTASSTNIYFVSGVVTIENKTGSNRPYRIIYLTNI